MKNILTFILLTISVSLYGQTKSTTVYEARKALSTTFQATVDSFLERYVADFVETGERFVAKSNDFVLDSKVKSVWSKTVTLKSKTSFVNSYNQTVYQRLYLGFYQYNSPQDCISAFDSLINCFGSDCEKIKRGVNGQSAKTTPCVYLFNEKEIVVCHIACEHANDFWTTFENDIKLTFGNEASSLIYAGCGGHIVFNKF